MKTEYEARFLAIDQSAIVEALKELSATCTMPRTLMRRIVFKNADIQDRGGWLRLRDQGEQTYLTYKQTVGDQAAIDSILEAEVEVGDFDATRILLQAMGFEALRYQENYRQEWDLDGVKFDLDTWPDIPTFLEIEGPDEPSVQAAAVALGLDLRQASYGSVDEVYMAVLDRDILAEARLTFGEGRYP